MEEYRKRARERYHNFVNTHSSSTVSVSASAQTLVQSPPPPPPTWEEVQTKLLTDAGYSADDTKQLFVPVSFELQNDQNYVDWKNPSVFPFLYWVQDNVLLQDMILDLREIFMNPDRNQLQLQYSPQMWKQMEQRWQLVNPYPVMPLQGWQRFHLQMVKPICSDRNDNDIGWIYLPRQRLHTLTLYEQDSKEQPFHVMQLWNSNTLKCDFGIVSFDSRTNLQGLQVGLSPQLALRNGFQTVGEAVCAQLVRVDTIRTVHDGGVGLELEYCPNDLSTDDASIDSQSFDSQQLQTALVETLDKVYILKLDQCITVTDKENQKWMYRVKRLFNRQGRPCAMARVYNIQMELAITTTTTSKEETKGKK